MGTIDLNDRRSVWLTAVPTVAVIGGSALVAGIVSHTLSLWIAGLLFLVASVLGYSSLLWGWPIRSFAKSESVPVAISEFNEGTPAFMAPIYKSSSQEMYQLGPYSWLSGFSPRNPDITLRAAVALPAVSAIDYSGDLATAVRGEAREKWLIDLLNESELTTWLRERQESSPEKAAAKWQVHGSGNADMTQLVFAPTVNEIYPFQAFCAVLTGWRSTSEGAKSKALRFLIELEFNRRDPRLPQFDSPNLDLNAAILTLDEIALNFTRLASTLKISTTISNHLLSDTDLRTGYFGLWFAVRNHMLEQVVDLSEIDRLAGSVSRNDAVAIGKWQSPNSPFEKTWGQEIAKMLDDLLEGAGYRGVTDRFNFLR